jgi:hypothetical protein
MSGNPPAHEHDADDDDGTIELITEVEVLDGPLVLARSRRQVARVAPQGAALVQTAAVAATGFVAGVATAAVLGRRRQRRLTAPAAPSAPAGTYRAVSHRTYLVDVHLLERR